MFVCSSIFSGGAGDGAVAGCCIPGIFMRVYLLGVMEGVPGVASSAFPACYMRFHLLRSSGWGRGRSVHLHSRHITHNVLLDRPPFSSDGSLPDAMRAFVLPRASGVGWSCLHVMALVLRNCDLAKERKIKLLCQATSSASNAKISYS